MYGFLIHTSQNMTLFRTRFWKYQLIDPLSPKKEERGESMYGFLIHTSQNMTLFRTRFWKYQLIDPLSPKKGERGKLCMVSLFIPHKT